MKKLSQLLVVAALATAPTLAPTLTLAADGPRHGGQEHGEHKRGERMQKRLNRMLDKVAATDAQRNTIAAIFEANKPNRKAHKEQRKALRKAFSQLSPATANYQQEVNVLADRSAALAHQQFIARAQMQQQIFNQLTAEQQVKWQEIKQKRAERRAERKANKQR